MEKGRLYIVATPIGNLDDITFRAIRTLKSVGLIAAEDTRRSMRLLKHYEISTSVTSYHDYTGEEKRSRILDTLLKGTDVALISDAGTPGISDPGYRLIRDALEQGIEVSPVPGPSVMIAALSVSGLPTDTFFFNGYLPNREKSRRDRLKRLSMRMETLVFYEAPHRLLPALNDLLEILGDRRITVIREMTKLYEEIFRGSMEQAIDHFQNKKKILGEITLVVQGNLEKVLPAEEMNITEAIQKVMKEQNVSKKDAVQIVAEMYGLPKNVVYKESILKKT